MEVRTGRGNARNRSPYEERAARKPPVCDPRAAIQEQKHTLDQGKKKQKKGEVQRDQKLEE
jgi:hypothetical protein